MAVYGIPGESYSAKDMALMQPNGKFFQMDDVIFYVLYCGRVYAGKRTSYVLYVRELLNEEISSLYVYGGSYKITYYTQSRRPGAEKSDYSDRYRKELENPSFKLLDIDAKKCLYKGNYICKDLKTAEVYSFEHSTRQVKAELANIKIGDIVSVCKFQNISFFLASHRYGNPILKQFRTPTQIILKKESGFKLTTAQTAQIFWARSLMDYNYDAEKEYPRNVNASDLEMYVCEVAKVAYGYASSISYDGNREVVFTDISDYKIYSIPSYDLNNGDLEALNENTYIVKAYITRTGACKAHMIKGYPTEMLEELEYVYSEQDCACYMDLDTYELYEIPFRYLPKGTLETDILCGCSACHEDLKAVDSKGRIFFLEKKK